MSIRSKCPALFLFCIGILGAASSAAGVTRSSGPDGAVTTRIQQNGPSVFANLYDDASGTSGFLSASLDRNATSAALDFSFVTPSTSNPDLVILVQGSGEIPASALSVAANLETARLVATTTFPTIRCEIDLISGEFACEDGDSVAFDLAWTRTGAWDVAEVINRRESIGPVKITQHGQYQKRAAKIEGTWSDYVAAEMDGDLFDTRGTTVIREIVVTARP